MASAPLLRRIGQARIDTVPINLFAVVQENVRATACESTGHGGARPGAEIAWSAGFENISHFRRQFAAKIGVLPGVLRQTTNELSRWN
jgi:transcriptional regulator GlxA family with amidase domain